METKADVQAVVSEYLRRKDISASELARRAGIPVPTLNRMLREDPTYKGQVDHWRQLARYTELHLDEVSVLAAVGLGPRPPLVVPVLPPLEQVERALHAGPWSPEVQAAVFTLLRATARL